MASTSNVRGDTLRKDSVHAQEGYKWQDDNVLAVQEKADSQTPTCTNTGRVQKRRVLKRKDDSLWDTVRRGIVDHQLGMQLVIALRVPLTDGLSRPLDQRCTPSRPAASILSLSETYDYPVLHPLLLRPPDWTLHARRE